METLSSAKTELKELVCIRAVERLDCSKGRVLELATELTSEVRLLAA